MFEWLPRVSKIYISIVSSAALLAILFIPIGSSSSVVSLSTSVASPHDNPGNGPKGDHCPQGVNHVPKDTHAYAVLVSLCNGDRPPGNPHK